MANFSIKTNKVLPEVQNITEIYLELMKAESRVYAVKGNLMASNAAMASIKKSLGDLAENISKEKTGAQSLGFGLARSLAKYKSTEDGICAYSKSVNVRFNHGKAGVETDGFFNTTIDGKSSMDIKDWNDEFKDAGLRKSKSKKAHYNPETKKWEDDPEDNSKKFETEITIASKEASAEWSAAHAGVEGTGKYGSGSASVDVAKAEAHAKAYAGVLSVGAEAGASFTCFDAKASGRLGNQVAGLYGNAEVEVGKVGATASAKMGMFDSEGKFKPNLSVGAEAEAVAAQASASAGATILGTDIGAKGSVGVGVGAHAKIGFDDGKFSCDVGAYLGVGASVSFEIDFSDTIDTVKDIGSKAVDVAKDVGKGLADAGKAVCSWLGF